MIRAMHLLVKTAHCAWKPASKLIYSRRLQETVLNVRKKTTVNNSKHTTYMLCALAHQGCPLVNVKLSYTHWNITTGKC